MCDIVPFVPPLCHPAPRNEYALSQEAQCGRPAYPVTSPSRVMHTGPVLNHASPHEQMAPSYPDAAEWLLLLRLLMSITLSMLTSIDYPLSRSQGDGVTDFQQAVPLLQGASTAEA